MRTTIDIPDELYRTLKARAALKGISLRELVKDLIEHGLRASGQVAPSSARRREPPPVIIPPQGVPIPAISRAELHAIEESDDEKKHARSA
ncbi:MAG TPA: hypothetical protein V6D08_16830 [Candidatus Obscuribacterales bacterium]